MPTLDLDPRDYATAGDSALSRERAVQRVARSASGALSGGYNMAGSDDGGERFAQAYDTAARGIFDAVDDAAEGARTLGRALIVAGALHSAAERGARGETGAGAGFTDPGAASAASTPPPPTSSGGNPMPVPGLEIVIDFLGGLLWPDADTDRLRTAADAWSQLSRDLTAEATELRRVAADLSGITSGEKSAFDDRIQELADRLDEIAAAVGDGGDGIATQCTSYAEQVDDTREQSLIMLRDLAIEIAATVAVSAALSLVTFGAAAAVGAGTTVARAAWYGARIATLINRLRAVAMTVATKLDDLVRSVRALQRWRAWQATGSLGSKVTFNAVTDGVGVFGASFLTSDDTNPFVAGATAMGGGAFANVLTSGRYLDNFAGRVFGGQISAATEYGAITALEGEDFNLTDLFMSVGLGTVGAGVTSAFGGKTRTSRDITSGQHQAELGAGGLSTGTQPGASTAPGSPGSPAASVTTDGPSGPRPDFDGPQTGVSDPGSAAGADAPVHIDSGDAPTVGASDAAPAAPTGGGTPVPQGEAPTATGGDAGPAAPQGSVSTPAAADGPVPTGGETAPGTSAPDPDSSPADLGTVPVGDGAQAVPGTPLGGGDTATHGGTASPAEGGVTPAPTAAHGPATTATDADAAPGAPGRTSDTSEGDIPAAVEGAPTSPETADSAAAVDAPGTSAEADSSSTPADGAEPAAAPAPGDADAAAGGAGPHQPPFWHGVGNFPENGSTDMRPLDPNDPDSRQEVTLRDGDGTILEQRVIPATPHIPDDLRARGLTDEVWAQTYMQSTHGMDTSSVATLGSYDAINRDASYERRAEADHHAYFNYGDWDAFTATYGTQHSPVPNATMFELFNRPFMEDFSARGMDVRFTHDPEGARPTPDEHGVMPETRALWKEFEWLRESPRYPGRALSDGDGNWNMPYQPESL